MFTQGNDSSSLKQPLAKGGKLESSDGKESGPGAKPPSTKSHIFNALQQPFASGGESMGGKSHIEIMSVDDDPINQMVIENLLSPYGYTITMCVHGQQCIEVLESRGYVPDLLLLDMMLPHLSGYEVCARLREKYSRIDLPIIMISAKVDKESIVKCLELGGSDFVHKPFHRQELLSRIKIQLELKSMFAVQLEYETSCCIMRMLMPESVVERLQQGDPTIVDTIDMATFFYAEIFADEVIKGLDLIGVINRLSAVFDGLCDKYGVEKIEALGQSLMAVARDSGHAERMSLLALEFSTHANRKSMQMEGIVVRCGLHSGPATAAVVGERMLKYSYIGETVAVCLSTVHHAPPDRVVVSAATREMLPRSEFEFGAVRARANGRKGQCKVELFLLSNDGKHPKMASYDQGGRVGSDTGSGWEDPGEVFNMSSGSLTPTGAKSPSHTQIILDAVAKKGAKFRAASFDSSGSAPGGSAGIALESGFKPGGAYLQGRGAAQGLQFQLEVTNNNLEETTSLCRDLEKRLMEKDVVLKEKKMLLDCRDQELEELAKRFRALDSSTPKADSRRMSTGMEMSHFGEVGARESSPQGHHPSQNWVSGSRSAGNTPARRDVGAQTQVDDFLYKIKMQSKIAIFREAGLVSVADLADLTEAEMTRVGVNVMGEQVRLRRSAQLWIQGVLAGLIEPLPVGSE